jgi:hypothetical protein
MAKKKAPTTAALPISQSSTLANAYDIRITEPFVRTTPGSGKKAPKVTIGFQIDSVKVPPTAVGGEEGKKFAVLPFRKKPNKSGTFFSPTGLVIKFVKPATPIGTASVMIEFSIKKGAVPGKLETENE